MFCYKCDSCISHVCIKKQSSKIKIHGKYMRNTWEIHVFIKYMGNTWDIHERIHGKYMGNTWEIHGHFTSGSVTCYFNRYLSECS